MKAKKIKFPWIKLHGLVKIWAAPIGCGLLFLFLLQFVFFVGYVPSKSMEPAIKKGSFIVGVRNIDRLSRGDIIIFTHKGSLLVKRVDALPGDKVAIGKDILTVPEGCCYVLGDNREDSIDSRYWEDPFVPLDGIIAKFIIIH